MAILHQIVYLVNEFIENLIMFHVNVTRYLQEHKTYNLLPFVFPKKLSPDTYFC